MATGRTERKRSCATPKCKTAISRQQSLDIVQFLIYGGLSALAWVRNFFAEGVFEPQEYSVLDRVPMYKDYMAGKCRDEVDTSPRTCIHALLRGQSKRVDCLLDWLEHGVFPALKHGVLDNVQVYVHSGTEQRQEAIESYTFSIRYRADDHGGQLSPVGLQVGTPENKTLSLEATNVSLMLLLEHIGRNASSLPELSRDSFLSMRITLRGYENPVVLLKGFESSADDEVALAADQGSVKIVTTMDTLQSGYHSSAVEMARFRKNVTDAASNANSPSALSTLPHRFGTTPSDSNRDPDDSFSLPPSGTSNMRNALQGMMQPESLTQGDTQLQSMARQEDQPALEEPGVRIKLLPEVISRLQEAQISLQKAVTEDISTQQCQVETNVVLCQCGHDEYEHSMIRCSFCTTWQHLVCYGFSGRDDPRIPDIHACYHCLLHTDEEALAELRVFVAQRRTVYLAARRGFQSMTDFYSVLGLERHICADVFKHLKKHSFVVEAPGSRKTGFAATGKPRFILNTSKVRTVVQDLFDPLRAIAVYYHGPPSSDQDTILAQTEQALVPSKKTPCISEPDSFTRLTPTTVMDADLAGTTTPAKPSMYTASVGRKRQLEDLSNTTKRTKSFQTTMLLSVNGLPSSPLSGT